MENISLILTSENMNVVRAALGKIPLEQSLDTFNTVKDQDVNNVILTLDQVNVVLGGLGKLPLEVAIETFNRITEQAIKQLKSQEEEAAPEDK